MTSKKVTSKLGSIGKVSMCKRVLKHQTTEFGEIPFYKISTFGGKADSFISKDLYDEFRDKYSFPKKGDILISAAGTIGETVIYDGKPAYFQDSNIVWIDNDETKILNSFLYYFYQTKPWLTTNGSTIKRIYNDNLRSIEITYPESLQDQQKIAAALSALDAKIELNARINAELESMAKTLYDYWFMQFAPHKSAGGKMVWNEALKREIPLGWEVCELRKYVTSKRGVSYSGKDIVGDGVPMINLNSFNMATGTYKPEGIKTYSGDYGENKILKSFDLVMCNTQQTALDPKKDIIGKSFLVPDIFETDIVSSHHVTAITVEKENLKYYLNSLFNTDYFHRYISGYATGTNILGLNFEGVLSFKTAIPNDDLLDKYKAIVVNVEKQKARIIKETQTLTELRDWLLPMLMNGQVRGGGMGIKT